MLLNDQKPLFLPEGSVRAIIALGVISAFVAGAAPIELATLVAGFYFGQRGTSGE